MNNKTFIAAGLMTLLIAFTNIAGKAAASEINPFVIVLLRYVIAMITIKIILVVKKRKVNIDWRDWKKFAYLVLSGILLNQIFFIMGLKYTVPSHPSLFYATTSIWVMILARIFGNDIIIRRHIIAAIISLIGVFIVLGKNILVLNLDIIMGDSYLFFAVLCWAIYTLFGKEMVEKYGALESTYIFLGLGLIVYLPFGLTQIWNIDVSVISFSAWAGVIYMGIFTSGISYILYYYLLKNISPTQLAILITAQPPTTIIISIALGFESFEWNLFFGGIFIISAILISNKIQLKRRLNYGKR